MALGALAAWLAGCVPPGLDGDYFGDAVSLTANQAIVGAPGSAGGGRPGRAFVFERAARGWSRVGALSAPDGKPSNQFGSAVAISGNTALVGAWGADRAAAVSGAAYLFERGARGWAPAGELADPDPVVRGLFGYAVALDESTAVVGAPQANHLVGAATLWSREGAGWKLEGPVTPDSLTGVESFGRSVALDGDLLVVAAHPGTTRAGAVFVFRRGAGGWRQEARLEEPRASFGIAIAVSGGTIAVASSGAVFAYTHAGGGWIRQAMLEPRAESGDSGFQEGGDVALEGDRLVVGADRHQKRRGAAYVFERAGGAWSQAALLSARDTRSDGFAGSGDLFGGAVSAGGGSVLVGASFHDSEGPNAGAAYLFTKSGPGWAQASKLVAGR